MGPRLFRPVAVRAWCGVRQKYKVRGRKQSRSTGWRRSQTHTYAEHSEEYKMHHHDTHRHTHISYIQRVAMVQMGLLTNHSHRIGQNTASDKKNRACAWQHLPVPARVYVTYCLHRVCDRGANRKNATHSSAHSVMISNLKIKKSLRSGFSNKYLL